MSTKTSTGSNFHPFHSSPLQVPWELKAPWLFFWSFASSHSSRWTRRPWCLSSPSPPSSQPMDQQVISSYIPDWKTVVWSDRNHLYTLKHIMPHQYAFIRNISQCVHICPTQHVFSKLSSYHVAMRRGTSWPKYLKIQPTSRSTSVKRKSRTSHLQVCRLFRFRKVASIVSLSLCFWNSWIRSLQCSFLCLPEVCENESCVT